MPAEWTLEPGWVSPSYGVKQDTMVVTLRTRLTMPQTLTYLFSSAPFPQPDREAGALLS